MSATITCNLNDEAATVLRHALEKDLNGRGWLQHGYVIFVQEISEPGIILLIENSQSETVDVYGDFPVRLQVEWEDIDEHGIKNKLIGALGVDKARTVLVDAFRTRPPEKRRGLQDAFRLFHRAADRA